MKLRANPQDVFPFAMARVDADPRFKKGEVTASPQAGFRINILDGNDRFVGALKCSHDGELEIDSTWNDDDTVPGHDLFQDMLYSVVRQFDVGMDGKPNPE